jgi:hypothetical protein
VAGRSFVVVGVITLVAAGALAHVAPSVDDNNRYLKLTPMGDRVRLAYTVFFGEVPGAVERREIDSNRDGRIDDAESRAFGGKTAAEVAENLDVEIDGHGAKVTWATVDVGLGTPATAAGSFSVDLVAYPCLPVVRGAHRLVVHDRLHLPHPGETEVRVEDSPGITIDHARIGTADDPSHDYKFAGAGGPLADEGLDLAFTASDKAVVTPDGACTGAASEASSKRSWLLPVLSLVGCFVLGVLVFLLKRR